MSTDKVCPTCGATYGEDHVFCPRDRSALRSTSQGDELIGSVVGDRYLVVERLGAGGMGEVYKAQDVRLQRPAAVKVLRADLARDPDAIARFSRECANGSRISSRHVAQVLDYGETEQGRPFLAMEFVPGESLKALLDREGALEPRRVIRLVRQIAAGLDSAHRLEVIHRDLKPENVLLCHDETGSEQVKVVDFGISKALGDQSQQVTSTGFVTGTREYMSPEQITGGPLDRRSDVYALGLLSYVMLTGRLPFDGKTPEHAMLMRLQESPRRLREARPDVAWSSGVQRVLDTALARDPQDRFASAGEMAEALAAAVEETPSEPLAPRLIHEAASESVPSRDMPSRRGWVPVAAVLLLGLAGVLGYRALQGTDRPSVALDPIVVSTDPPGGTESGVLPDRVSPRDSQLVDSAPKADSAPKDAAPMPEREETRPRVEETRPAPRPRPAPPAPTAPGDPSLELRTYGRMLMAPGVSGDSARRILASIDALRARLTSRSDSVQAEIYRAEALALAGEGERACAVLEAARLRATARQREKIGLWEARQLCTFSEWTPS